MSKENIYYIKMDLKQLLETIQEHLAFTLDSWYNQAKELIGTEKQHNLGVLKEDLKNQIENYLKYIVKNIIYNVKKNFASYGVFSNVIRDISKYLNEAIKNGE